MIHLFSRALLYLSFMYIIYIILLLHLFIFLFLQLINFAQDVENELKTQVVQAERVDEKKFSMFLVCI